MQHSCVVNLQKMSLHAGEETVGFLSQCDNKKDPRPLSCHVAFSHRVVVPKYCQMQLSVLVKGCHQDLGQESDVTLEPEAKFMEHRGLLIAYSLSHSDPEQVVIQLLQLVKKNEKVGSLIKQSENVCIVGQQPKPVDRKACVDRAIEQLFSQLETGRC